MDEYHALSEVGVQGEDDRTWCCCTRPSEGRFPHAADVLLVVEVADAAEAFDRAVKLPRYAVASAPGVWLVLPGKEVVEQHRSPGSTGYAYVTMHTLNDALSLAALPDVAPLPVRDVLGGSL